MAVCLGCVLVDLGIAFSVDKPVNTLVQTWDAANSPAELSQYAQQIFTAFKIRSVLMLLCFTSMLVSFFLPLTNPHALQ